MINTLSQLAWNWVFSVSDVIVITHFTCFLFIFIFLFCLVYPFKQTIRVTYLDNELVDVNNHNHWLISFLISSQVNLLVISFTVARILG